MEKQKPRTRKIIDDEYAISIYTNSSIGWNGFDKYLVKHPEVLQRLLKKPARKTAKNRQGT